MNDICHAFNCTFKKWWKFSKKTIFGDHFQRFFVYTLLRPMSYTQIFSQIIGLIEIHNRGKFHQYSICSCEVIYFQRFS